MNILCRILAVFAIVALVGCAAGGGSGGGSTASAPASDNGGLSDEKLKEIGIRETYDKR